MNNERKKELKKFEKIINVDFDNIELLDIALTHSSYANQYNMNYNHHNERLEFLGDSVLSIVISEYLFKKCKSKHEGKLTRMRSAIVCESSLAELAKRLDVKDYIKIGKGEEISGGRQKDSLLADACEAIIAAIYLDKGYDKVKNFILKFLDKTIEISVKYQNFNDYKSRLQEYVQKTSMSTIKYVVDKEEGPDHDKTFEIKVYLDNKCYGTGTGKSKKESEQCAAMKALKELGVEINE